MRGKIAKIAPAQRRKVMLPAGAIVANPHQKRYWFSMMGSGNGIEYNMEIQPKWRNKAANDE